MMPKLAGLLFAGLLTITLIIGGAQNYFKWVDDDPPEWLGSIDAGRLGVVIGTSGTAAAFLITLYVADRNYRRSREGIPSLTMDLTMDRIPASKTFDVIIVTLNAKNTGTGLCDVDEIQWCIRALSPYADSTLEELKKRFEARTINSEEIEFPWRDIEERVTPLGITIEPNETEQVTQDFLVDPEITALAVTAWVVNATAPKTAEGWYRRSVHSKER